MTPNFLIAFDRVIGHEGGFQFDSTDRGNWTSGKIGNGELRGTKFGISAMSYQSLDIKNLTVNDAQGIYWRDWWERYGLERAGLALGFQLFDAALHHGSHNATEILQSAAGVTRDGIAGPKTVAAVRAMDHNDVLLRFLGYRLRFMSDLRSWPHWGRGWARRISTNLLFAADDN